MASVIPNFHSKYDIFDLASCIAARRLLIVSAEMLNIQEMLHISSKPFFKCAYFIYYDYDQKGCELYER
jgi:hypothetical protein